MRFYAKFYCLFFFSFVCFVAGCSTIIYPPAKINAFKNLKVRKQSADLLTNFEAFGKVGFSDGKKGGSATLQWIQQKETFFVRLYGPLGSGTVQISGQPGQVVLTQSSGKSTLVKTPETLVHTQLGLRIPLSGLPFWLRGLPAPGIPPNQIQVDVEQRIWKIQQQGWTISYQAYQFKNGMEFPLKLTLKNGPIQLRFIFQRWRSLPSQNARESIDTFQSPPS